MARKMDNYSAQIEELRQLTTQYQVASKELRNIEKQRKQIIGQLLTTMQTSTEATIDGQKVFEVKETQRRSTRIDLIMQHAPELADKLIETKTSKSIKFA